MDIFKLDINLDMRKFMFSTASVYALYYFYKVVHRPCLIAGDGEFKSTLQTNLHILKEHYWPTFWAFTSHFQTICRPFLKSKPDVPYRREILTTEDGGHIAIDWVDNDVDNTKYPNHKTRPIVVIMPGIVGCSDANYIRHISLQAKELGYSVVVFNNRGMGDITLKTPRTFCACNSEDLTFVLHHVTKQHPIAPIVMFAVSLGGALLTNYLVKNTIDNMVCALIMSAPWDSTHTTNSLEQNINWFLYNRFITKKLKTLLTKNLEMFKENLSQLPYKLEEVLEATTIREFDERFTSKTFGFGSLDAYYEESTIASKPLENIKTPVLYINAKDDPFSPVAGIPLDKIQKNPNLAIILTDYGGHVGFVEGLMIRDRSIVERLFEQYVTCMLENNNNQKETTMLC